ncbi:GAF domain-containing protein [Streptomyces sp. NPDC046915]|uniref:GAF domain-containing protein n=1 Tax=Streptomyces sp. NPDC046915 TaxID=3155257 RepID=UPI0033EB1ECA
MNDNSAESNAETDPLSQELLRSVVDVARAIFGAAASSVFLLDEARHELVFQAVSGQGENVLVGRRLPARSGIAGWVAMSGEPVIVDDLSSSADFDRDFAESTQYVPHALMAAPLIHGDRVLGVLEVLDPAPQCRSSLDELDLLALFARQAAVALRVVADRRRQADGPALDSEDRTAALRMAEELRRLLESSA